MPPKTPAFWQDNGMMAWLLTPLSKVYFFGHKIKMAMTTPYTSGLPVLCVGGVVAGGSGKTPVVHAIIDLIRQYELFINPVILSRGYGGALKGPTYVDPSVHTADDVGDEALLHARKCATIVSRDRSAGARLAESMGADLIILDDGLQNNSLTKTMSILVIDGIGNGCLLPAGPLREPLQDAAGKCVAIVSPKATTFDKPVLKTILNITTNHDQGKNWFAFAGIGRPEKFKETLEKQGFKISRFRSFSDHHPYTSGEIESIMKEAGDKSVITTEKDWVRLSPYDQGRIEFLGISLSFENPALVIDLMKTHLSHS